MAFHDIRLERIAEWKSTGGPGNSNGVITVDSGQETRNVRWAEFRHQYDIAKDISEYGGLAYVKRFALARGCIAHTFRFVDPLDFMSTEQGNNLGPAPDAITDDDQQIGVGDGATTQFQLVKRYQDDAGSYVRTIRLPVEDTVVVAIDGTNAPSGWSVNLTTGVVTFSTAPALGEVITAGFEFDVEVRFGDAVGDLLALSADSWGSGSIVNLPLIEVLDGGPASEDLHYGGAKLLEFEDDASIDLSALVWSLSPDIANHKLFLPDIDDVPQGGPIFVLHNLTAHDIFIQQGTPPSDSTVVTLGANESALIFHGLDASSASIWVALVFP